MNKQVNLYEAKTQLSRLVDEAAKGKEIVIAKNGKPLARLVSMTSGARRKKRKLGGSKLRLVEVEPRSVTDAEIAKSFLEGKLWPDT